MMSLLKQFRGKVCTFYREEEDGTNYGWTGVLLGYDKKYLRIRGSDGHVRLLNQRSLDIIIEGNWAAELEVKLDPSFKNEKED